MREQRRVYLPYIIKDVYEYKVDEIHDNVQCTGWQRPIGSLNLQVLLCKRASNDRALLRKMTYEDKASYDSTPPCESPQQMQIHTGRQGFEIEGVDCIKTGAT